MIDTEQVIKKCRGLIDSEYDVLCDFSKDDLWDYLASIFPTLSKEDAHKLHREFFGDTWEEFKKKENS